MEQFSSNFYLWWTLCIGLHPVCTVSNYCLSLYLNVGGLQKGPGKTYWWCWKVLEKSWNFLSLKVWEPRLYRVDSRLLRCAMWQVSTLLELIQQLRGMKLTSVVHATLTGWADATRRVDTCRRDEIANAINRHRTKNISQTEKDKGSFVSPHYVCLLFSLSLRRRRLYDFGSSVRAAVRATVRPCVRDSRGSFMFPRYLQYLSTDFRQTFVTGASWDRDELIFAN